MIQQFFCDESGQALVEYGLLIALVALVIISAVTAFGAKIKSALYDQAATNLPN